MRDHLFDERGVTLIDVLVACFVLAIVASGAIVGLRGHRTHTAALALEAALGEAGSLASSYANASDIASPSGATVVVEPDAASPGISRITVYRSRPVRIGALEPRAPVRDSGFPPQRVHGTYTVLGNPTPIEEPFAIMLSGAGYASVAPLAAPYDEGRPQTFSLDPGCPSTNARISVRVDGASEEHAFACTGGRYVAD